MKHCQSLVRVMVVATVFVALSTHVNSATADGDLVEIDSVRSWTLSDLGYGPLEQTLESNEEKFTLARYLLPEDAKTPGWSPEGDGTW